MIMDSLAALALATEKPKDELLLRPPQRRDDYIVSRKMTKHIMIMAAWMCIVIYVFVFAGEYLIPEPEVMYRYNEPKYGRTELDIPEGTIYPGRLRAWNDDPLYEKVRDDPPEGQEVGEYSRHMTWVFDFFVFMQIWNMICARKIHDEFNIFEGIHLNWLFILVWLIICVG